MTLIYIIIFALFFFPKDGIHGKTGLFLRCFFWSIPLLVILGVIIFNFL